MTPQMITPVELARETGWSERRLRELARKLGACRIVGNRMLLTQSDVDAILEASRPCPSHSTSEAKSGTTGVRLPGGSYAELQALLTKRKQSASQRTSKTDNGKVISMARARS